MSGVEWAFKFGGTVMVLFLGIVTAFWMFCWMAIQAIEQSLRAFKAYRYFCEYIYWRHDFKKWLKANHPMFVKEEKPNGA